MKKLVYKGVYNNLIVLDVGKPEIDSNGFRRATSVCECLLCGSIKTYRNTRVRSGDIKSCGCTIIKMLQTQNIKHGHSVGIYVDEYGILKHAIKRCENEKDPGYHKYGGRGIKVSDRYKGDNGVINLIADIGPRPSKEHSLDRWPDNDGNYEVGNLRWATDTQQSNNRRNTIYLEICGVVRSCGEWSEISGTPTYTIRGRKILGWSDNDAVYGKKQ